MGASIRSIISAFSRHVTISMYVCVYRHTYKHRLKFTFLVTQREVDEMNVKRTDFDVIFLSFLSYLSGLLNSEAGIIQSL
jgi:hypothetical protein